MMRTMGDNVEMEPMTDDVFMFGESPSFSEVVDWVKLYLGCSEEALVLKVDGVIDVGSANGPRVERLAPIKSESDWVAYKLIVMSSEVRSLDLIVRREFSPKKGPTIGLEMTNDPTSEYVVPQQEVDLSQQDIVATQDNDLGEYGGPADRGIVHGHVEALVPSNCDYEGRDANHGYGDDHGNCGVGGDDKEMGVPMASNRVDV